MNANQAPMPRFAVRAFGATLAAALTLSVVSLISQGLHVERFGNGTPEVVELDRVTVTAQAADPVADAPTVAAVAAGVQAN